MNQPNVTSSVIRRLCLTVYSGAPPLLWESDVNPDSVAALKVLDEDPANTNNVLLVYSGASMAKTNYGDGGWEREHLWPNSYAEHFPHRQIAFGSRCRLA